MDIIQTVESAAHTAVEAVEHPFHTIGERLKAAGEHLAAFFGHPYCAPPLQGALEQLHGVIVDLAQEVAELRVPCPCKPASTASSTTTTGDAGQDGASTNAAGGDAGSGDAAPVTLSPADLADLREWQAAKARAASFTGA
jgi:hypothetical protein